MRTVWALTKLVVRESIRKRLWILLGTTCAVILLVPLITPSMQQGGTLQIAQSWLLTCIMFFGIVTVFFIAGTSLPGDLREGRLFLMFTKPVHRSTYLVSKFLGFALVLILFLSVTGGVGYLMLQFMNRGQNETGLTARKKHSASEFQFHEENIDQQIFSGGIAEDQEETERLVVHAKGTTSPVATWTFTRKLGETYERPPKALLHIGGMGASKRFSFKVRLFVEVPVNVEPEQENQEEPKIKWKRVQREIKTVRENQLLRFAILPNAYSNSDQLNSVFDEFNRIRVLLAPVNRATRVSFHRDSIRITGPDESYLVNYGKALFMIFLLLMYLSAFLMAVTPVLSGPISICLALLFYMIGSMSSFFRDALSVTESTLQKEHAGPHTPNPDIPDWALQYSHFVVENLLAVVPNFEQFNQQTQLMEGWHIPMSTLYNGAGITLPSMILFIVVGALLFQAREITT